MCGIAGILGTAGDRRHELERMLGVLRHRGPDDENSYLDDDAGLGQTRLSIIDLEGGLQPLSNEDGSLRLVCNGEIYNYQALRRELISRGHRFATGSDCEVILHLYEEHGERCLEHLRGMFAFALWDVRGKRLFAARDHLGQKPFYYAGGPGRLAFASEIKGLLAMDPSLRELDIEALDQYLTLRLVAPPRSMFRRVRKLPPGSCMTWSAGEGARVRRYWDLSYQPKHGAGEDDLVDELEALILESLRLHMVSDVPVGAFLSGGLDSGLVVSMLMAKVRDEPIPTFSMGLPHGRYNEAPWARRVAERYGTAHHEQVCVPSLVENLPELVWHLDEPSDPLSVCAYLIARLASAHVKVVLGGDGGDELFGGYDRYYGNVYAGQYARLPAVVRERLIAPMLSVVPEGRWYKSLGHQLRWLHSLASLEGGERYAHSLSYFYFDGGRKGDLYGPRMREALGEFDPAEVLRGAFDATDSEELVDRMLHADSMIRLPDHPVMITDRMSMAHGLEVRSPLMDHRLAEFAARIPVGLKVRGRSLRRIQRKLAARYLPEEVMARPKQGFSSALPYLLDAEYRLLFGCFLRDSLLVRAGLLRAEAVEALLAAHLAGKADHGNRLWLLLNAEVWYRMQIEGHDAGRIHEEIAAAGAGQERAGAATA